MYFQRKSPRDLPHPDTFDASKDYNDRELEEYADAILRADARTSNPINGVNPILFEEHLYNRRRREILVESGMPDETITQALSKDGQMMYNRQHPQGRKVNSEQARREHGAAYYR